MKVLCTVLFLFLLPFTQQAAAPAVQFRTFYAASECHMQGVLKPASQLTTKVSRFINSNVMLLMLKHITELWKTWILQAFSVKNCYILLLALMFLKAILD